MIAVPQVRARFIRVTPDGSAEKTFHTHEESEAISFLLIDGTGLGPCAAAGGAQQVEKGCKGLYVHEPPRGLPPADRVLGDLGR